MAIGTLNGVMRHLQEYLLSEHEKFAETQIAYLQKRKEELSREFEGALAEQVAYLENSMSKQGYLNLAQEIEMLSEPKERFLAQKRRLDVEENRWKKESLFASAGHPWKEGLSRTEALDIQRSLIEPISAELIAEYEGIDLETVQTFYSEYSRKKEALAAEQKQLVAYTEKIALPEFSISALAHLLHDPASQQVIQKGIELSLQIGDRENRSERELTRLQETLQQQKEFLANHLSQKGEVVRASLQLLEGKVAALQLAAIQLIGKEKKIIDEKLEEIADKMGELPKRWGRESQLRIQKELALQVIEGLTKLSESKVVDHHLFHVESKPLEEGDAPLSIEPPHLLLYSSLGSLFGGLVSLFFLIVRACIRGLPLTVAALRQLGYSAFQLGEGAFEKSLALVALEIDSAGVVTLVGGGLGESLKEYLMGLGKKVLCVDVRKKEPMRELPSKLSSWEKEYDCILLDVKGELDAPEAMICGRLSDWSILVISNETAESLSPYAKEKTLCLVNR